MWVGIGVGIGRNRFATGIFNAYALRVTADGGITEAGQCVDAVTGLLLNASLLLIPSGYKGGKLYSQIPTNGNGDLTWTRGSDAFRTNASGLIQRVPWNLVRFSEDLTNAAWVSDGTATVTANATTAPDKNLTADRLQLSNSTRRYIYQTITPSQTTYTYSIYLRANSNQSVRIGVDQNCTNYRGALICNVTNEWQRFTLTLSNISIGTVLAISIDNITSNITQCTGTASNVDLFVWGAQLVEGTTAQTYLPTTDRLNFPRLSYMYGSCPSVLLEPQRTNLLTYSQAFNDATWAKVASTGGSITATDNYNASPDGNTNASRLLITNLNSAYVAKSFTSVNGSSYTISIWAKSNTASSYTFQLRDGYSGVVSSNLTVTPTWQRFTLTFTASGTTAELQFRTLVVGSYDLSIYGAQAELGAYPTTYIPTTTATATRVADSAVKTGISSLIGQSEGTVFLDFIFKTSDSNVGGQIGISDSAKANRVILWNNSSFNSLAIQLKANNSNAIAVSLGTFVDGTRYKIAIAYKSGDTVVYVNGTQTITNSASFTFSSSLTDFILGGYETTMASGHQFCFKTALFTSRLSNLDLATLTT